MPQGDWYEEDDPLERALASMSEACDASEVEEGALLDDPEELASQSDFEERYARMQEAEL